MRISKGSLKVMIGFLLLLLFVLKLTAVNGNVFKTSKTNIFISNDSENESGSDEKKNESQPAFNFNEFLSSFPDLLISPAIYYTIHNLHPGFLISFFSTHYPDVSTPPPNC